MTSLGALNIPHDGGMCMVYYLGIVEKPIACSAESSDGKMCYGFNPKELEFVLTQEYFSLEIYSIYFVKYFWKKFK